MFSMNFYHIQMGYVFNGLFYDFTLCNRALLVVITETCKQHIFSNGGMFARDFLYALTLCQSLAVGCYGTIRLSNDLCHIQMGNICNGHFV